VNFLLAPLSVFAAIKALSNAAGSINAAGALSFGSRFRRAWRVCPARVG